MRLTIAQMMSVVAGAAIVLAIAVALHRDPMLPLYFVAGPALVLISALYLSVLSLLFLSRENRCYHGILWLRVASVSAVVLFISLGILSVYIGLSTADPRSVFFTGVALLLAGVSSWASLALTRILPRFRIVAADSEPEPSSIRQELEQSR
jgi:hypothetical protein